MKKRFLGMLMTLVMAIGLLPATAFAADCENHAEACIEAVQELVDTLPDMTEIDEDNREEVIATLEAIDEAKLHLTDAEREEIDWTKYSDAAFVLCTPAGWFGFCTVKRYEVTGDNPAPMVSFINEDGEVEAMVAAATMASMTETELEPNGEGKYFYLPEGKYAVHEEVEGEWDMTLSVNGEEEEFFEGIAGRAYRLVLGNSSAPDQEPEVTEYPVWVGGVQLTSENKQNVFGDGTVSYDAGTNTLTLNNYVYVAEETDFSSPISVQSDLTVVLAGKNSLTSNNNGIQVSESAGLTIKGNGGLTIKAAGAGIYTGPESSGVIINNSKIKIESGYYGIYASQTEGATAGSQLTINGGNIEVNATSRGIEARVININDDNAAINGNHTKVSVTVSQSGPGGKYYAIYSRAGVTVADNLAVIRMGADGDILNKDGCGFYAKEVLIEEEKSPFVKIGDAKLSVGYYLSNKGELCSKEPEGGYARLYEDVGELILELKDFCGAGLQSDQDLTLVLKGENKLERSEGEAVNGIFSDGDLTIEGNGSLEVVVPHAGFSGIAAKGVIIVKSGDISVRSGSYGMVGYTDITISGGDLDIESQFDGGIFAKDHVNISGRNTKVILKVKEGEEAIHTSDGTVTIGDGLKLTETESGVVVKADTEVNSGKKKSSPRYDVDVDEKDIENGSVKINSSRMKKGSTVTITVTPDAGYELDELIITDKDGDEIEWKDKGEGRYSFVMPRGDVEIEASFKKIKEDVPAAEEKGETEIILTIGSKIVLADGEAIVNDVAPVIRDSRTFLPIRVIAEELGADVAWNEAEQTATITKDDLEIVIYIGQPFATVNGEPVALDAPAFIENGRTYLPLRFVAENLGAEVIWDGVAQTVTITFSR